MKLGGGVDAVWGLGRYGTVSWGFGVRCVNGGRSYGVIWLV